MNFETVISVGMRDSALSQAQYLEVQEALRQVHPEKILRPLMFKTTGDKDLVTSLRTLDKTDFFTKEIDDALLAGECRVALHSAKDLPEPLREGLKLVALTRGLDPKDVIVYSKPLQAGARIGTSSKTREERVLRLFPDARCLDIRGTIEQRLELLDSGILDAVVVAEAALLRLKIDRQRLDLPGESTSLQGQLAVVARSDDREIEEFFSRLDTRRRFLYLGLDPSRFVCAGKVIHYPVIYTVPRQVSVNIEMCTHFLFTSKEAVTYFFAQFKPMPHKKYLAIGNVTAGYLRMYDIEPYLVAVEETQEGMIEALEGEVLEGAYFCFPRSSRARPLLTRYLEKRGVSYLAFDLYDTLPQVQQSIPDLTQIDAIVFTSPSTVDAFLRIYGKIAQDKELICQGPITQQALQAGSSF